MFILHNKKITNALKFLYQWCSSTATDEGDHPLGYHGVSSSTVGVSALAQHLLNFEITSQVPDGLSKHVTSSKKTQFNWYRKLLKAWRATNPPPKTPEEASWLVIRTLKGRKNVDLEGLLSFYGLSYPARVECTTSETPQPNDGLKFVLHTLPVDARAVPDGDGITVYVSTSDSRESSLVPQEVHTATVEHNKARAERNFLKANSLKKKITDAGYGFLHINNEEILARKYRIRLRGIDAPENAQSHGKEAKDELVKIIGGKCLKIEVYDEDQYGRFVGDVFCDGIFVQKLMLKNGLAWHYITYDKRPQLAKWEKAARARRLGLWASPNPEKPWEWRKNHREQRNQSQ